MEAQKFLKQLQKQLPQTSNEDLIEILNAKLQGNLQSNDTTKNILDILANVDEQTAKEAMKLVMTERILEARPSMKKIVTFPGTFDEYVYMLGEKSKELDKYRNEQKIQELCTHAKKLFDYDISSSDIPTIFDTSGHFGVLSDSILIPGNIIHAEYLKKMGKNRLVTLLFETPLRNVTGTGFMYRGEEKINFFTNKYMTSTNPLDPITPKNRQEFINNIPNNFPEKLKHILLQSMYDNTGSTNDFLGAIMQINNSIRQPILGIEYIGLPYIRLMQEYIKENPSLLQNIIQNIPKIIHSPLLEKEKNLGTYKPGTGKTEKSRYKPDEYVITIHDDGLYYMKDNKKIILSEEMILEMVQHNNIEFSLFVLFSHLLDMGLLPTGGFMQIEYMQRFIATYGTLVNQSPQHISLLKENMHMFAGLQPYPKPKTLKDIRGGLTKTGYEGGKSLQEGLNIQGIYNIVFPQ